MDREARIQAHIARIAAKPHNRKSKKDGSGIAMAERIRDYLRVSGPASYEVICFALQCSYTKFRDAVHLRRSWFKTPKRCGRGKPGCYELA